MATCNYEVLSAPVAAGVTWISILSAVLRRRPHRKTKVERVSHETDTTSGYFSFVLFTFGSSFMNACCLTVPLCACRPTCVVCVRVFVRTLRYHRLAVHMQEHAANEAHHGRSVLLEHRADPYAQHAHAKLGRKIRTRGMTDRL